MAHTHSHSEKLSARLGVSAAFTLAFVVAETAAGLWANSLALLSDAGHNLTDVLALPVSWYAAWLARKPADARRTFGYHRAGILAALANTVSLVLLALWIAWEAVHRLRTPEPAAGGWMIGMALAAVVLNGVITLWLRRDAAHDLNLRSAYLHMLGDALSALGVVVAGVVIELTGAGWIDPLASLLIAGLILWTSWETLADTVNVLLEAAPRGLDLAEIEQAIRAVPGVHGTHHLHVWTVASNLIACSCHIVVAEQSVRSGQQILGAVVELLEHRFDIGHATVQVEVEGCGPDGSACSPAAPGGPDR